MANEIQGSFMTGHTVYALVRSATSTIANTATSALESYQTAHYSGYVISATEQGAASAYYTASMPTWLPAGTYNALFKQQLGSNPVESDPTVDVGSIDWNGSSVAALSSIATSGIASVPVQLQRGVMISNYEFYLRSSTDHVTPLTSGLCSGQISKDGGAFTALASGIITEVGNGFYSVTLTSGDTSCNTMGLLFTANGVNGGSSDPLPQTFILQHTSGF